MHSQVVINEFAYDDSGPDDQEYVELYNFSPNTIDLTGWYLATGSDTGFGPTYRFPEAASIDPGSFYVAGNAGVPDVDFVLTLMPGETDLFGNGPGYVVLGTRDDDVVDRVVYEANKGVTNFPPVANEEGGLWGNHTLIASSQLSWQRWFDGYDTDENGADFGHLPWTPGGSNERSISSNFESSFEEFTVEERLDAFPGSFVPALAIDPLRVTASNPGSIVPSPDGGQALIAWDPAGGGNFVVLNAAPLRSGFFEAWIFFDARPELPGESETWSLGFGTSGTFFNIPVLFNANGNTGVTWTYQVTDFSAILYLVDEGIGGVSADKQYFAEIEIIPGENDGWQRLRLEIEDGTVVGNFGGNFGEDGGERVEGDLIRADGFGTFYVGYREAISNKSAARPPTLDRLVIRAGGVAKIEFRRGDANADGALNLSDPVFLLNHLFLAGELPTCEKAADADDGGSLNITDAVFLLNHLFQAGPAPEPPLECGTDATADSLDCRSFPGC